MSGTNNPYGRGYSRGRGRCRGRGYSRGGFLNINKKDKHPVYLQLAAQLTGFIQTGNLKKGERLPGSRALAAALQLHRKTVVSAYEELTAQGWLESRSGSGTYVTRGLPEMKLPSYTPVKKNATDKAGFVFSSPPHLETPEGWAPSTWGKEDW